MPPPRRPLCDTVQERLDYIAYYDVLTGLANRSLFLERTARARNVRG